jgi:CRP-like cAMP-binding protein/predicted negative regulator of RcsB-dependent stress response
MPKSITYKANSVIYFQGDQSERIFILKSGKVLLKTQDIETSKEITEIINTGEFFGVKSALGRYIRDETCISISDAEVLAFTVPEFEQLALSNTRIIMKMLKVFSNQLRRIHHKVENMLRKGEEVDAETGLYKVGDYYFNNRQFAQAAFALSRYLTYYPQGKHATQATLRLQEAERYAASGNPGSKGIPQQARPSAGAMQGMTGTGASRSSGGAKEYYEAVGLISQEKYQEALNILYKIISNNSDPENMAKAEFEVGRCLTHLKKFDEAIRHFTALIQKYPKHPDLKEALFLIGKSYEGKGDKPWARSFYEKVISLSQEDEPTAIRAKKAMQSLTGGAV